MKQNLLKLNILIISFVISLTATSQTQLGLIAYYPFNGNANDESIHNNDGIIDGPILTKDIFNLDNKAYYFDGNDDIIRVKPNIETTLNKEFTIMAWINPEKVKTQVILKKQSSKVFNSISGAYKLYLSKNNKCSFSVSTESEWKSVSKEGYKTNEWQLLTGVKKDTVLFLYVDGILSEKSIIKGEIEYNEGAQMVIGTRTRQPANTFQGKIDEIRIYNRALNQDEITSFLLSSKYYIGMNFKVYPNPFINSFKVSGDVFTDNYAKYELITIDGQVIKDGFFINDLSVNTKDLNKGIYILKIVTKNKIYQKKILKY